MVSKVTKRRVTKGLAVLAVITAALVLGQRIKELYDIANTEFDDGLLD